MPELAALSLEPRLTAKIVLDPSGCWLWTGALRKGYGTYMPDCRRSGLRKLVAVHRLTYEAAFGPIPAGLHIDHLCRTRACVNPAHLEAVTQAENNRRSDAPSAIAARTNRCARGHDLLAPGGAYFSGGKRRCRVCALARRREAA